MTSGSEGAAIGHNSALNADQKKKLAGYISEIETFDAEARDIAANRGATYKAAKDQGFDTKAIKRVVAERRMDKAKAEELANTIDTYKHALGMLSELPLGRAAIVAAVEKATEPAPKKPGRKKGDTAEPPKADLPHPDTSDRPFAPPAEGEDIPTAPEMPTAA